ncbi:hypothetical protein N7467_007486 [Penicillium canescens]|nr:hypothetical protein N7467_007486 [Penicillium canescens]
MTEAHRYVRSVAPTLILVPNALIDTWITEVEKHFGDSLTLIIFFDSSTRTGDRRRKRLTASKLVELQKTLDKLDLTVPSTGTTEFSIVRFNGDKSKADAIYKAVEPLTGNDIAEIVVFSASRRENIVIADTLVFPQPRSCGWYLAP